MIVNPAATNTSNSITVNSIYNAPISSGQVSVLTSGSNNLTTQTIPIGLNSTNQVSVTDSNIGINSNSINTVIGTSK